MLVELKNGETLNGHLVNCDNWMNLTLKEVVQTSPVRFSPRRKQIGSDWIPPSSRCCARDDVTDEKRGGFMPFLSF